MERTLVGMGVKSVLSESSEHLLDMFPVVVKIIRVDQNVVQINENAYIQEIRENVIHKMLKSGGGVGKSKGHNAPLKRTISSVEHSFPFGTFTDPDKMISMLEINFGEVMSFLWTIQEIGDLGEQVSVFLCNLIQATDIDTKAEGAILLLDKEYWSSTQRSSRMDETI